MLDFDRPADFYQIDVAHDYNVTWTYTQIDSASAISQGTYPDLSRPDSRGTCRC